MNSPILLDPRDRGCEWRKRLCWTVSIEESNRCVEDQAAHARRVVANIDDPDLRDGVLLALPNVLSYSRAVALTALAMDRAERDDIRLTGKGSEIDYLATGEGRVPILDAPILPDPKIRFRYLRRLARIRTWTPLWRLPKALLFPEAVAVTNNPLLQAEARRSRRSVGFSHAHWLLSRARRRARQRTSVEPRALVGDLVDALLPDALPSGPYRQRAERMIEALATAHVSRAVSDMHCLRDAELPGKIWSGSGGPYAPRAVGLEVLRRGGDVVRFDHGTPRGLVESPATGQVLEFDVTSRFIYCTEPAADLCSASAGGPSLARTSPTVFSGARGDPMFSDFTPSKTNPNSARRPKIVYAPTQLLGFRQMAPAMLPDPIYLDWQIRVTTALTQLPVELLCQPHPEGLYKDHPHPLERIAPTRRGGFTAQLKSADIFIFDYPCTTALWEAICCTDKKVIYLDLRMGRIIPAALPEFEKRCTVLSVASDEAHRPILDANALAEAVLTQTGPADPSYFRWLLAGSAHCRG